MLVGPTLRKPRLSRRSVALPGRRRLQRLKCPVSVETSMSLIPSGGFCTASAQFPAGTRNSVAPTS